jgi:hypothetical protein
VNLMNVIRLIKFADNFGLCNRLFPFAHLIASAEEYGWTIENEGFFEFSEYFQGTIGRVVPGYGSGNRRERRFGKGVQRSFFHLQRRVKAKLRLEHRIVLGDHDLCDLSDPCVQQALQQNQTTQLIGLYFYNNAIFRKHAGLIRNFFTPIGPVADQIRNSIQSARAGADVVVGVHIRHGDYQTFCNGIMYYSFAEYAALMRLVAALFPEQRVSFLICSNGTPPAEEFQDMRIHQGPGHTVGDVYALAECDYIVGPPSTYSEWASFYGQVPRYMHRAKDYEWNGQAWPGVTLQDFVVHTEGFARCSPSHPASLVPAH